MFKKLYNKLVNKKKGKQDRFNNSITKLNKALHPTNKEITIEYEEITEYEIKGVVYKLGDRVICRSNECDPLMVGTIISFWDNEGKWSNAIPQVKDDLDGKIYGVMGTVVHYNDELMETLKPMRMLEQWNHLLPDNVKEMYSYTEEQMNKKEKQYNRVQKNRDLLV